MSHVGNKGVLLLVVAAHAVLLWLWSPRVPPPQAPTRRTTVVIIALPAPPATPEPENDKPVAPRSRVPTTTEARPASPRRGESAAISLPPPSTEPVAAATAASQATSAPKPLDLAVRPREALRPSPAGAALNDARSNTQRLSAGERMAQTLGTDTRLHEEIRPDGSVRLRQGTNCYDARESRAAGLDPYNSAISPKPRQMSAC